MCVYITSADCVENPTELINAWIWFAKIPARHTSMTRPLVCRFDSDVQQPAALYPLHLSPITEKNK